MGLPENVYQYLLANSIRENAVQLELREVTAKDPMARMQISPEQGQFMALLIQLMGAKHCIEVGVFTGYSSLCVAQALPPGGKVVAFDVSEQWTSVARRFWEKAGVANKVDLRIAPAVQTLDSLIAEGQAGKFDFAFIDADKENYLAYYDRCLKLIRPHGLIAIDNTLWSGRVADSADQSLDTVRIRELNAALLLDQRVSISMLPVGDGLTLALKH